jgi:hypothetical protein
MNLAIAWIERHLTDEIEWEDAAREAGCSLFPFLSGLSRSSLASPQGRICAGAA